MAIVQKNLYMPGQNLTNLALNVDINRLGVDKSNITVNYGTVPATVTIKEGSIIEVNGNVYAIEGADYSFQMSNATHNYITFTDNPVPTFGSAAVVGTYSNNKYAYYQADNVTKTLGWFIDQTISEEFLYIIRQTQVLDYRFMVDRVSVTNSAPQFLNLAPLALDTILTDRLSNFDNVNYKFVCKYPGEYGVTFNGTFYAVVFATMAVCHITKNATNIVSGNINLTDFTTWTAGLFALMTLDVGDEVTITAEITTPQPAGISGGANMAIFRLV
jgi:hypothetical protein